MTVAPKIIPAARPMPNCVTSVPGLSESAKPLLPVGTRRRVAVR